MTIVVAHNFYQQSGGEDEVFVAEVDLLRRNGHRVETFVLHNDAVDHMLRVRALAASIWNRESYRALRDLVRGSGASVVHFHNTFPLISAAGYQAARDEGAAVVQTLHNFRLICPCALLFRDGHTCELCVGRNFAWPGIRHKCYRDSFTATGAVAGMVSVHRALGTYHRLVDFYISPSPSARTKLIEGGLPADRIVVKPNFLPDPGAGPGAGNFAIFAGRLSREKGLETLLEAWRILGNLIPLKIIGDGPLAPLVADAARRQHNIEWLGRRPLSDVYDLLGQAALSILSSRCYETFGRVAVEAFAKGTPVVASRHGAMADLVEHGRTGALFEPGNPTDLAEKVRAMLADPALHTTMRSQARREYETHYTDVQNYQQLMEIYARAQRRVAPAENAAGTVPVARPSEVG
jgi:glycosyltransferase involved in cell wall biosynthesis